MSVNKDVKEEHIFPEDWFHLSEKQTIEELQYLWDHYKEYEILKVNDDTVEIAGISFFKFNVGDDNAPLSCYYVNRQKLYSIATEEVFKLCEKLFDAGQQEAVKREEETKIKLQKRMRLKTAVFTGIMTTSVLFLILCFKNIYKEARRNEEINKQVKKYEQSLPNYDEYKATKDKIAQYGDSLKRSNIK